MGGGQSFFDFLVAFFPPSILLNCSCPTWSPTRAGLDWTTVGIPCPSVLSNKVAGQSQFSTHFDHLFLHSTPSFFLPGLDIFLCHFLINFFLCFLLSCGPFYRQFLLFPPTPPAANNNNNTILIISLLPYLYIHNLWYNLGICSPVIHNCTHTSRHKHYSCMCWRK